MSRAGYEKVFHRGRKTGPGRKSTAWHSWRKERNTVVWLRSALALDHYLFARLLAVHVSTIYRWEKSPRPALEGLTGQIFESLSKLSKKRLKGLGRDLAPRLARSDGWRAYLQAVLLELNDAERRV